ncbi:Iron-sulfur assembly protein 1 [Orbilia blumenaviensis]|uniref:Iron-sulfur assembly protein 1 n=1 Tax=Orbilia blumenaviensis TaxID=1796055 RepID=A0AAV9VH36_9PEZI
MSLPRTLISTSRRMLAPSVKSHYAQSSSYLAPSICASCLRRSMQTATPYRPETLGMPGMDRAPPRNKDAPMSELARRSLDGKLPPFGTLPVERERPAPPTPTKAPAPTSAKATASPASKLTSTLPPPQKATVTTAATTAATAATPAPRKLRPRKAAMTLTPLAVNHLRSLTQQTPPKLIRVGVKNKGCSGLAYHLEYIESPGKFDEVVEQEGVKVYIDSKALFSIIGSEMDWVEDRLSARFVFKNPNIKEECGCGESFMVHAQRS